MENINQTKYKAVLQPLVRHDAEIHFSPGYQAMMPHVRVAMTPEAATKKEVSEAVDWLDLHKDDNRFTAALHAWPAGHMLLKRARKIKDASK